MSAEKWEHFINSSLPTNMTKLWPFRPGELKKAVWLSVIWPTNLILYRDISLHPHIKYDKAVIISKAVSHLNTIKRAWPYFQSLFLGLICIMNQNVLCIILGHAPMLLYWKFQSNRSIRNNVTAVFVFWTKWLPAAILDFRWRWHEQFKNNTWSPHCSQSYRFPGLVVPENQIVLKNPKWLSGGHIEFWILIRWTIYDPLVVMFIHTKSEVNPSSSFRARVQKVEKFMPMMPGELKKAVWNHQSFDLLT